jgi:hypothetical protein
MQIYFVINGRRALMRPVVRALLASVTCAIAARAQSTRPGVMIVHEKRTTGVELPGAPRYPSGVDTTWYAGDWTRVDNVWAGSPLGDMAAYSIRRASTRDSYLVRPKERTVLFTSAAESDSLSQRVITATKADPVVRLGDGGRILGHATMRYKLVLHRTIAPRGAQAIRQREEAVFWIAVDRSDPVIDSAMQRMPPRPSAYALPAGVVLRSHHTVLGAGDKPVDATVEATRLALVRVDTMKFMPPVSYRRITRAEQAAEVRAHVDSLFKAQRSGDRSLEARIRAWLKDHGTEVQSAKPKEP